MANHSFQGPAGALLANSTLHGTALPPLPSYTETPIPDLLPFISDFWLSVVLPIVVYWIVSLFFHAVDVLDLWPQHRLHTPEEILRRNHATRYEVARDVIIQQVVQMVSGALLSIDDPVQRTGKEDYDVAVWATRVRLAQRALPGVLGVLGVNATAVAENLAGSHPLIAGALAGGRYPFLTTELAGTGGAVVPAFAGWELLVAKAIYWAVVPSLQLFGAVIILDTWQYFLHRLMHVNKWLYTTFHSRHHRLYVPYAYGALYNHPFEGFLLDTLGAGIAYKVSRMSIRQGTFFFCFSTVKTVDDHCGYSLPWDPMQHITSNNAAYHDIHHQTWGIKTNFSQPFFTFWDRLLSTMYVGSRAGRERTIAAELAAAAAGKDAGGKAGGHANGKANGHANGKANGHANGKVKA